MSRTIFDAESVSEVIACLPNLFLTLRLTPEISAEWALALRDYPPAVLAQAAEDLAAVSPWPSISGLRECAARIMSGNMLAGLSAIGAWAIVERAIESVGAYRPAPAFSDPRIAFVVDRFGWANLCAVPQSAYVSTRARFAEEWDALNERIRLGYQLPRVDRSAIVAQTAAGYLEPGERRKPMSLRQAIAAGAPALGAPRPSAPGSEPRQIRGEQ